MACSCVLTLESPSCDMGDALLTLLLYPRLRRLPLTLVLEAVLVTLPPPPWPPPPLELMLSTLPTPAMVDLLPDSWPCSTLRVPGSRLGPRWCRCSTSRRLGVAATGQLHAASSHRKHSQRFLRARFSLALVRAPGRCLQAERCPMWRAAHPTWSGGDGLCLVAERV